MQDRDASMSEWKCDCSVCVLKTCKYLVLLVGSAEISLKSFADEVAGVPVTSIIHHCIPGKNGFLRGGN